MTSNSNNNNNKNGRELINKYTKKNMLIVIVILVFHTIAAPIFEKLSFHYIHESGISMLLGMICGLVALVITPTVIKNFNF